MRHIVVTLIMMALLSGCKTDAPAVSLLPENRLELTNGYEHGLVNKEASEAFSLANDFITHERDLRRFLITDPSVHGSGKVLEVHYKLFTKIEESEAIVRVDLKTRQCTRIK